MDEFDKKLDEMLKNCKTPEEITGPNGLLKQLTKRVVERAMNAEMDVHLGYGKHSPEGRNSGNSRNGKSKKTIKGDFGKAEISVPRDRNGEFEPQIIKKGQHRFEGFDGQILSMYGRGMTVRDIQGHLKDQYAVDVSKDLISSVTDAVIDDIREWQNRPLEPLYPVMFLDALFLKIRDQGHVIKKAVYVVIGINEEGRKEVLGLWVEQNEGAKFWMNILTELKNRGVEDVLICCVDGLKGFPEAIEAVFPKAEVQQCVVHMIRNSMRFVSWKNRKEIASDLKPIYKATTAEQGLASLEQFGQKWDKVYPAISKTWRDNWERVSTFFAYVPEIRKIIYTTNIIESLNMPLKKVTKNRSSFPNDEAAIKLLYLALNNVAKKWSMSVRDWPAAMNQFLILYEDRFNRP